MDSFNPDAYLAANSGGGFNPDAYLAAHAAPSGPSMWDKAVSNDVPGGGGLDLLGRAAKVGGRFNAEMQKEAGDYAENLGRAAAKRGDYPTSMLEKVAMVAPAAIPAALAEAAIPQNRLAAGLALLGPAMKGAGMLASAMPETAEAIGNAASRVPAFLRSAIGGAAPEAAPAAVGEAAAARPAFTDPRFANGTLLADARATLTRQAAMGEGEKLAASQAVGQTERAAALPNMRELNATKNNLRKQIASKWSEINDFTKGAGNESLSIPEQARLKVLQSQLKQLQDSSAKVGAQLSSAASAPGIRPMAVAQVPEAAQVAVSAAEKEAAAAQAATYARLHPTPPPAAPMPVTAPEVPALPTKGPPPTKPGVGAQLVSGLGGRNISQNVAQYAIDHPGVLDNAKTVEEANAAYADAVPGLKGKVQSLGARLGKTVLEPGDYSSAINRAGRLLNGTPIAADGATKLNPQDALEGVQTINAALKNKMYTSAMPPDQVKEILKVKDGLMDFLQNNGAPNVRAAARDLFEAHVKDAFSDWLPRNKFGSTDAFRTIAGMSGMGKAGALALAGHPGAAIPIAASAAAMSPRVLGGVIKNAAAIPNAASMMLKGAPAAANLAGQEDAAPSSAAPVVQSPGLIANILKSNVLNPQKSGTYGAEIKGLGLPSSMVSGSGKTSITQLARLLHEAGAISENDEGEAVQYLKSMAGRVK